MQLVRTRTKLLLMLNSRSRFNRLEVSLMVKKNGKYAQCMWTISKLMDDTHFDERKIISDKIAFCL